MAKKTYSEKLRDPRWQKKRLSVLSRDNFTCQLCSDQETELHVHHKYYTAGAEPWEYENEILITYCAHCHFIVEALSEHGFDAIIAGKAPHNSKPLITVLSVITRNQGQDTVQLFTIVAGTDPVHVAALGEDKISELTELFRLAKIASVQDKNLFATK